MNETLTRSTLRNWCRLEDIRENIQRAVENENLNLVAQEMKEYISTAFGIDIDFKSISWFETAELFRDAVKVNTPTIELPMIQIQEKSKEPVWDYPGRTWYFWWNIFSKNYGWSEHTVAELDINDAIALYQEILVDVHTDREWEWSLSEIAYPYNKSTKKNEYKPYPKPRWFRPTKPVIIKEKKVTIRKEMLPVGNVIRWDQSGRELKDGTDTGE